MFAMTDDVTGVAWKLDLAFGFRPFGPDGIQAPRVLQHKKAYELVKTRIVPPPDELLRSIRLWRFFSGHDVHATDFLAQWKGCGLSLDEVMDHYFMNDKKKEFKQAVRDLLLPMDTSLSRAEPRENVSRVIPKASPEAEILASS